MVQHCVAQMAGELAMALHIKRQNTLQKHNPHPTSTLCATAPLLRLDFAQAVKIATAMSAEPATKTKKTKRNSSKDSDADVKPLKKTKKSQKAAAPDADAPAPKRSKAAAPATPPKKAAKKASSEDSSITHEQVAADKEPADLDNFRLSEPIKKLLRSRGIASLFPIQQATLDHCLNGHDVVGRARTGCGKTLAFVLPIIESLGASTTGAKRPYGRAPSVVVLAPTRELAKQVLLWLGKEKTKNCVHRCFTYRCAPTLST